LGDGYVAGGGLLPQTPLLFGLLLLLLCSTTTFMPTSRPLKKNYWRHTHTHTEKEKKNYYYCECHSGGIDFLKYNILYKLFIADVNII
jgi:hypothetical protein